MANFLVKIKELILDAVFPHICLCGKWGVVLCDECIMQISKNKKELCPICLKLSDDGRTCSSCRSKSNLTGVMVFGKHEKILKTLIWRYKYDGIKDLSGPLAALLAEKYGAFFDKKRFIVTAVPISKSRKKWRGFDQSREVAKILAKKFNLEYMDTLGKKETKPQVGLKRVERIKNIQNNIFITDKELNLGGSRVVMIDDVYTSGSTLEECAKILRQAGAREVWGMVLSRD